MLARLFASPRRRLLGLVTLCAAVLFSGFLVGRATAAQPRMQVALERLQAARSELEAAVPDKAGHRVKAIALVDEAIGEVRLGIAAGRR